MSDQRNQGMQMESIVDMQKALDNLPELKRLSGSL